MTSNSDVATSSSSPSPNPAADIDPLLKDFGDKKQCFTRNVVSLAMELKDVRTSLALKEQSFVKERLIRQATEAMAKNLEEERCRLQKSLEDRNGEIQASTSAAEKYVKELDHLRSQLTATQATADMSAASAQSAQVQCLALLKELDNKNNSLKEHEDCLQRLAEQLDSLQKDLQAREFSQKQLKNEVLRVEHDIMEAVTKAGATNDCELRNLWDKISRENLEKINRILTAKDIEIAKLKDEIRILSVHWQLKTNEMESQLEKHRRANQELKKRVLKLEFCLQEARSQTRKLQRMGERRDNAIKELRDQLATKQQGAAESGDKHNFWESSGFKILVSVSMLILVVVSKR
ncbi:hypothetical protein Nepgr_009548 [Nepenthes gracilis]|uniref:Uncharacterized protein n=1 Tax=Nepenthes gracilis TaxID=150966 RepID=A0AAD3XK87_NEPGR|nr:hypothetical protein Nepgr_009548 [Nepenthes gracilis]